jgi:hypothetical protein
MFDRKKGEIKKNKNLPRTKKNINIQGLGGPQFLW